MKEVLPQASVRQICTALRISRSAISVRSEEKRTVVVDELLVERVRRVIDEHPTFGYRRVWAILRFREKIVVNRKAVYRILRVKGWFTNQRTRRP